MFEGQSIEWKGHAYSGKAGALYFWIEQLCLEGVSVVWVDEEGPWSPMHSAPSLVSVLDGETIID